MTPYSDIINYFQQLATEMTLIKAFFVGGITENEQKNQTDVHMVLDDFSFRPNVENGIRHVNITLELWGFVKDPTDETLIHPCADKLTFIADQIMARLELDFQDVEALPDGIDEEKVRWTPVGNVNQELNKYIGLRGEFTLYTQADLEYDEAVWNS